MFASMDKERKAEQAIVERLVRLINANLINPHRRVLPAERRAPLAQRIERRLAIVVPRVRAKRIDLPKLGRLALGVEMCKALSLLLSLPGAPKAEPWPRDRARLTHNGRG